MGIEGTYLNIIKAIYNKPTANIALNGEKLSLPTTSTEHSIGSPSHSNQIRKRNKRYRIGREEVKLSSFADDMILHIENPKDSTQKLLELIK